MMKIKGIATKGLRSTKATKCLGEEEWLGITPLLLGSPEWTAVVRGDMGASRLMSSMLEWVKESRVYSGGRWD